MREWTVEKAEGGKRQRNFGWALDERIRLNKTGDCECVQEDAAKSLVRVITSRAV